MLAASFPDPAFLPPSHLPAPLTSAACTPPQANNNKFYIIQLLVNPKAKQYEVWTRWGRVGVDGQHACKKCGGNLEAAKKEFTSKFRAKTENAWSERHDFQKVPGKYLLIEMDYSQDDDGATAGSSQGDGLAKTPSVPVEPCTLHPKVQALVTKICDISMMQKDLEEVAIGCCARGVVYPWPVCVRHVCMRTYTIVVHCKQRITQDLLCRRWATTLARCPWAS